jgi:hypothetical protein
MRAIEMQALLNSDHPNANKPEIEDADESTVDKMD